MRKLSLTLAGIIGTLALFVLFNQLDKSPSGPPFAPQDIPAAKFGYDNGFYIQWALAEPPEVDIMSHDHLRVYRRLHDPAMDGAPSLKWDHAAYKESYRTHYRPEYARLRLSLKVYEARHMMRQVKDAPLPNLLAWLETAKLYTAVNLFQALEGDWTGGASNILDQIAFGKRAVKGSRYLMNNLIAKAITSISIQALGSLINAKECPPEVFKLIISHTPPLQYEEYGTRTSLICEYVGYKDQLEQWKYIDREFPPSMAFALKFLTQKNRTLDMVQHEISEAIHYEKVPPFQWQRDMPEISTATNGAFWWLQNTGGKILFDHHFSPTHFKAVVLKSFRLKTYYQMLRISAQLHEQYKPERPVRQILEEIPATWTTDPCSGNPFIWDEAKQILYSLGTDRIDDGGALQKDTEYGDFTLPVILYVQGN